MIPRLFKIKYYCPTRKVYLFYMNGTLFGSVKRADYEIALLKKEQEKLIKKDKPVTMKDFKVCYTNGRTVHRLKEQNDTCKRNKNTRRV